MSSGKYKRTKLHIRHISGRGNLFFGKKHKTNTKRFNSIIHTGRNNINYREIGSIRISKGYKHIKTGARKWTRLSRYLTEQYIGYKLKKGWMVHHIDGNQLNDKLSNFYIFKNMGLHLNFEILIKHRIVIRFILNSNLEEFKKTVDLNKGEK